MAILRLVATLVWVVVSLMACGDDSSSVEPVSSADARIDALFAEAPSGSLNRAEAQRLLDVAPDADQPFYYVSLLRHRERARYADGRQADASGAAADGVYGALALPILSSVGAQVIYSGSVERSLIDHHGAAWDQVSVVLYPSRAQFVAMLERADYRAATVHRIAGVEQMIGLVTEAREAQLPEALRHVNLSRLKFPPTASDPPVTVVHLLDFNDIARFADGRETTLTGREAMSLYEQARAPQAFPLGIRPGIKLTVVGQPIGDGRPWEEFRINNFPSRAAFAEITTAESLDEAGIENREAALADTYALLAAPTVNQVGYLE